MIKRYKENKIKELVNILGRAISKKIIEYIIN